MIWKVNKFTLSNFKMFKSTFTLEAGGKNVLIYAENGCGKSSIFWGFYTMYESCKKDPDKTGAQKYFDNDNPDNLRNKFSSPSEYSGLVIEFVDNKKHIRTYEDSSNVVNTKEASSAFMALTRGASDFLHYRHLSSLFDFKNSQRNDVFQIFESDLFQYLDFSSPISSSDFSLNVKEWWDKICKGKDAFADHVKRSSPDYRGYQESIKAFNNGLHRLLDTIIEGANSRLHSDFNLPIELVCDFEGCVYDKHIGNRRYDKTLYAPKIVLSAKMKHDLLPGGETNVERMKSFFNEARITCMALAVRLSILDQKVTSHVLDYARTLFIDDLLISLDMSNRLLIINVLLNLSRKYQLFFFTHDRALYNLISEKVEDKYWRKYELVPLADFTTGEIPGVKMVNNLTPILWAHKYYKRGEFFACANALRRECERQAKRLLPNSEVWTYSADGEARIIDLAPLLDKLNVRFSEYGLPTIIPNVQIYRKHILNPGSHDSVDYPIYRRELQTALSEIERLSNIVYCQSAASPSDGDFEMTVTNGTFGASAKFKFMQPLTVVVFEGKRYYNDPIVSVIEEDGAILPYAQQKSFTKAFLHLCNRAHGLSPLVVEKLDCCTRMMTGKTVSEIINNY